jgi:AraC-like DNA-binding protein
MRRHFGPHFVIVGFWLLCVAHIAKTQGEERTGGRFSMLQSRNFAPSDDLSRFVRRYYVFDGALPGDVMVEDALLAENAFVRILIEGDWRAETSPGNWSNAGQILLFGGNSRPLPVRVKGPFKVAGFAVRPSAWRALFKEPATHFVNQMVPLNAAWGNVADDMLTKILAARTDAALVAAMEEAVRAQLEQIGRKSIDEKIARFEAIARADSTIAMDDAAAQLNLSVRQMERRCMAAYGITPKAVFRRSRFLDMAEAMRGFSSPGEEILATLRYFDQSHLNREFRNFSGMTPGKFAKATTPLFTAGLKLRVEGKGIV